MKRALINSILVLTLLGCSKKSEPTSPIIEEHGNIILNNITAWSFTYQVAGQKQFEFRTEVYTQNYESNAINTDSCKIWIYLSNGKIYGNIAADRSVSSYQPNPQYTLMKYDIRCNSQYPGIVPITPADSIAIPDSIIARMTYTNSTGPKQKIFKVTPADSSIYSYSITHNP